MPPGVQLVALPPVGLGAAGDLTSLDPSLTLDQAWGARRALLLTLARDLEPAAVIVELFPFGRRKFAAEIVALLEEVRSRNYGVPVLCSVRDLLVTGHPDKQGHDDETAERLNRYFDAVIVHADPAFSRLEETFSPRLAVKPPLRYSGFVCARSDTPDVLPRLPAEVVVSAGGGMVGAQLFVAAVAAHRAHLGPRGFTTRLIAGPFLPADTYAQLESAARHDPTLIVHRYVPDLCAAMAGAAVSVSQCGYNTSIDILRARVPAVVVPYDGGQETEQAHRAARLAELGVVAVVPTARLAGDSLAEAVLARIDRQPARIRLKLDGAAVTAGLVEEFVAGRFSHRAAGVMTAWTAPLRQRLGLLTAPVPLFFRDDDAGRSDPQLRALVAVFAEAGTAVDVAAIPAAVAGASQVRRSLGRSFRFVELANDINEHMPEYLAGRVSEILNGHQRPVNGSRILLLGLANKRKSGDCRESAGLALAGRLIELGAQVRAADPHVSPDIYLAGMVRVQATAEEVAAADLVVLVTHHDEFDLTSLARSATPVLDTRRRVHGDTVERL